MSDPAPCNHKKKHQHGSHVTYVVDSCRCDECRSAHSSYALQTNKLKAYGRYDRYNQPAGPVRDYIRYLRSNGIIPAQLSKLSGVSEFAIYRILRCPDSGIVRARTARAIFAVRPTIDNAAGHAIIDSIGTARRLQALVAIGWNLKQLTEALGYSPTQIPRWLNGEPVRVRTAREVSDFYDRMWCRPAPPGRSRKFALRMAAERGYASPLAWDDDEIDDPNARPHGRQYRETA